MYPLNCQINFSLFSEFYYFTAQPFISSLPSLSAGKFGQGRILQGGEAAEPSRVQGSSRCSLPTFPQHLQIALARSDTAAVFFLASSCSNCLLLGLWAPRQLARVRESCAWIGKSDQRAKKKTTETKLRSREKRRKAKQREKTFKPKLFQGSGC